MTVALWELGLCSQPVPSSHLSVNSVTMDKLCCHLDPQFPNLKNGMVGKCPKNGSGVIIFVDPGNLVINRIEKNKTRF